MLSFANPRFHAPLANLQPPLPFPFGTVPCFPCYCYLPPRLSTGLLYLLSLCPRALPSASASGFARFSLCSVFKVRSFLRLPEPSAPSALVGSSGLEPPTLRLSGVRSNQLSYEPSSRIPGVRFSTSTLGGDEESRTLGPLLAKQVLSHLSYTPMPRFGYLRVLPRLPL